jgi:hypothetical protein
MLTNQREALRENDLIPQSGSFKLEILYREADTYGLVQLASCEAHRGYSRFRVLWRQLTVLYRNIFQPRPLKHVSNEAK